jgi:hypothetical protein
MFSSVVPCSIEATFGLVHAEASVPAGDKTLVDSASKVFLLVVL